MRKKNLRSKIAWITFRHLCSRKVLATWWEAKGRTKSAVRSLHSPSRHPLQVPLSSPLIRFYKFFSFLIYFIFLPFSYVFFMTRKLFCFLFRFCPSVRSDYPNYSTPPLTHTRKKKSLKICPANSKKTFKSMRKLSIIEKIPENANLKW